ncbi:MAG: NAD-dependent epimerase/dehydratase family protein, partial [Candidatus Latescibacterota bacterium]
IRDLDAVRRAARGVDAILHHAAVVSVPLSVEDPVGTNEVNVGGTLHVLVAAREERARRVVFASSTAVYGDSPKHPKSETDPFLPLSPYAASKCVGEIYGALFHRSHAVPFVALRYFNVFGPGQDEHSPYAAAIPLLTRALLRGERPVIYGDGTQTRDFVFISDVVAANLRALDNEGAVGGVFNIARGVECDLNALAAALSRIVGTASEPRYAPPRAGDILRSLADTRRAREILGFEARVPLEEGLRLTVEWYRENRMSPPTGEGGEDGNRQGGSR